jgi:hypothetical protein
MPVYGIVIDELCAKEHFLLTSMATLRVFLSVVLACGGRAPMDGQEKKCSGKLSPSSVSAVLLPCVLQQQSLCFFVNTGSVVHWHRKSIGSTRMRGTSPIHNNARRGELFCNALDCRQASFGLVDTRVSGGCWGRCGHTLTRYDKGAWKHDFARFVALEIVHAQLACRS